MFDLGGVLLDWDPRYVYRELIADETEMERFLAEVCSPEWHHGNDLGTPYAESCAALAARHPAQAELIWAWAQRSEEMVAGTIEASVRILGELQEAGVPCYALTNMEAETYPRRRERFDFLRSFAGTVVSSSERVAKPDVEIFRRMLRRFGLTARRTVIVDDAPANVEAAAALGMIAVRFHSPEQLRADLCALGLPIAPRID